MHRQTNKAEYPWTVSTNLEVDIEPTEARRRAAISTVSVRMATVKASRRE